jgi:hypothetical protein
VSGGAAQQLTEDHDDWSQLLAPGDVTFVSAELGDTLAGMPEAADGLVISTVADWLIREESPPGDEPGEQLGDTSGV